MANKTIEALVKCPFFNYEKGNMIACEGYVKGTCMAMRFDTASGKHAYLKKHCYRVDGRGCFFADGLYKKYNGKQSAGPAAAGEGG